ncbi:HVA22 domain membrane protein [Paecilomyces variotii No. 5]|uniref:Protein YOP1 n=1 Tax=Byssochlamys spectabilis (strain No. 5 / NBRC 109023) TaxID=1356009 RepID=V5I4Q9_BYSSN|nr:HVA22 domain membrane protein [Paecilomyces variotii No. 5]
MFGIIADFLSSVISILFPAFASYKALRTSDPRQLAPWLMYWVVLTGVLLAESWTVFILGWFPFYSWIRLGFMAYLVLPQTQGARVLYQEYVEPFLEHHEREIDLFIGRTHERAKAAGLQYFYMAIDLIREKLLGLPPQQAAHAAPPPSGGAAGYAQSLIARFNLPSAAASSLSAPATDLYSMLSSAVTNVASTGKSRDMQADELSASGTLLPREVASLSPAEKAKFIATQRERLDVLRTALAREEKNLGSDHLAEPDEDLAYGSAAGLRKNLSNNSFDHISRDDLSVSNGTRDPSRSRSRSPAARGRTPSGGWTTGWFNGVYRTTSGEYPAAKSSGVDR